MFWTRLGSGVILLAAIVVFFAAGGLPLAILLAVVSCIGYIELSKVLSHADESAQMTEKWKPNAPDIAAMAAILIYYGASFALYRPFGTGSGQMPRMTYALAVFALFMLTELGIYVCTFPKFSLEKIVYTIFSFFYAPFMLSFVYFARSFGDMGKYLVWLVLISSWGGDTCAYCVGILMGKHKIFPVLSPKKTLEGCLGGALGAALIGWIYGWFYVEPHLVKAGVNAGEGLPFALSLALALICLAGAVFGMIGDLAASAIKRHRKVKDYGTLIPGHGGIMDRFDSMMMTAPAAFLLAYFLMR